MEMRPTLPRLHAFRGLGEDGGFVYFRVSRRRRSCPGAAKEPEWAAGTSRHRRDYSPSVAHRAKEEVSSRVAASPRRIGSADPSSRLGSWSRVAPRIPQKTLTSHNFGNCHLSNTERGLLSQLSARALSSIDLSKRNGIAPTSMTPSAV